MKVKFGSIITDGRNKLGGHVYSRNHYGNFSRTNTVPTLVQNDYTQPVRNNFLSLIQGYTDLSPTDRLSWQSGVVDFPRTNQFGDTYYPTGQTLFTWLNRNLYTIGLGPLTTCPTPVHPTTDLTHTLTIAPDLSTITIDFPTPLTESGSTLVIASTRPLPASRNFVSTEFRIIDTFDLSSTGSIDITTAWLDKFSSITPGGKIFTKLYLIEKSCGLSGVEFYANDIASTAYTYFTAQLDGNNFVELQIQSSTTNDIEINWGDGNIETVTPTMGMDVIPHSYGAGGTYIMTCNAPDPYIIILGDVVLGDQFADILHIDDNAVSVGLVGSLLCINVADLPSTSVAFLSRFNNNIILPVMPSTLAYLDLQQNNFATAPTIPTDCIYVDLSINALPSSEVNAALANLVANAQVNGDLYIDGQTPPAAPTGTGITDAAQLVTDGWTVTTD